MRHHVPWFDKLQEKRRVLRSDKDVERLDDKREARAEGGRRFKREGPIHVYACIYAVYARNVVMYDVCIYVCMYAFTYVSMYVCMLQYVCMCACMHICMYVCTYVMYVCSSQVKIV